MSLILDYLGNEATAQLFYFLLFLLEMCNGGFGSVMNRIYQPNEAWLIRIQ